MSDPFLVDIRFRAEKSPEVQRVILEALAYLKAAGIPFAGITDRNLERMAMAFLAVANVKNPDEWNGLQDETAGRSLKTRDIITFINAAFEENISSGSYDDIRRKDLLLPIQAGIVVQTNSTAARNNPQRGYALHAEFAASARLLGTEDWRTVLQETVQQAGSLKEKLEARRRIELIPVHIRPDLTLNFSPGEHNLLQKAVIEEFLPRYGYGADVLYVGDASDKYLLLEEAKLQAMKFFEISHGELPDIVAYSASRNWLFLIEAFHSSGAIAPIRKLKLEALTRECTASLIYITTFATKERFRQFLPEIAWETEVWIAESPDHLIHFNGDKFLGPYRTEGATNDETK